MRSRRPAQGADDRGRLRAAAARVPRHLDLEDPLPRGPEAARRRGARQGGYRLYSPGRRVAAAHDPAPPARRVPAAARDPAGAGRRARRLRERGGATTPPSRARCGARRSRARPGAHYARTEVLEYTGADERLVRELEEYGVLRASGATARAATTRSSARSCARSAELTRYGVAPRNLRVFRTSADREAVLIEQILGPALRSRNRERRKEAVDTLESLAAVVSQLKHLMLVRDLRKLVQLTASLRLCDRAGASRVAARPSRRSLGRGLRPAPPAALVAEGRARRGRARASAAPARSGPRCSRPPPGKAVRAEFRCRRSREADDYGWEQEIEDSPFAKVFSLAVTTIELEDAGRRHPRDDRARPAPARAGRASRGEFMLKRATRQTS